MNTETSNDERERSSPIRPRGRGRGRGRGRSRGASGGESERGRGRGQGRPRGRGRGRGRAQGRSSQGTESLEERRIALQTRINHMEEPDIRDILLRTAWRHPSLLFDILDVGSGGGSGGYHPALGSASLPWCKCGNCRDLPTPIERVCCGKSPQLCISQLADFRLLILDEAVLAIARMYRQDVFADAEEEDFNKANRYAAYRQYTLWQHGRLGAGVRILSQVAVCGQ